MKKLLIVMALLSLILSLTVGCNQTTQPETVDVVFYLNDGTDHVFTTISAVVGDTNLFPENDPQRPAYKFIGWYLDPQAQSTRYDGRIPADAPTSVSFHVYAGWEAVFMVDFICEYTEIPSLEVAYDALIQIPNVPPREGFYLDGWYTDSSFEQSWNFALDRVYDNMRLYARWIEEVVTVLYSVTFKSDGGSQVDTVYDLDYGSLVPKPMSPVKDGYDFGGWFIDKNLTESWDFKTDVVVADVTLYARWVEVPPEPVRYTVRFDTNGGNDIAPQKNIERDSLIVEPNTPVKSGYTFEGWYSDRNLTKRWDFAKDTVTGDMILYVKWAGVVERTYTVTFNSDGGSPVDQITNLQKNSLIEKPDDPIKTDPYTDYYFAGWFTESNYTKMWDFGYDRVNADMTLFAKWIPILPAPTPMPVVPGLFNITINPGTSGAFSEPYVIRMAYGEWFTLPYHEVALSPRARGVGRPVYVWYTSPVGVFTAGQLWQVTDHMTFTAQN